MVEVRLVCGQKTCVEPAASRMYWPGRDRLLVCAGHLRQALGVAEAMGFHLEHQPVADDDVADVGGEG